MKPVLAGLVCFLVILHAEAQVKIHSHNDYAKPRPFYEALENKVFSMEADIFPLNDQLFVAHNKTDITKERSLEAMYIQPILKQFALHKKTVLDDTSYTFSLLVDVKEDPATALKLLVDLLNKYPQCFDRRKNPKAVQVIITGDQGDKKEWNNYPSYIYFDGRPYEDYSPAALDRIAIVSDNFFKY